MNIVLAAKKAGNSSNEIKVVEARKTRGRAVCSLLPPSLAVQNWTGIVQDVSTVLGGDSGVLAIDMGNDVNIETWNNGVSDIGSNTLISPRSALFRTLGNLSKGDTVAFSGSFIHDGTNCIQEQSLIDQDGMESPDFSFRFTSVKKIG